MVKKIIQIVLAVAILGLVYVVYIQISTPIKFDNERKAKEKAVIEHLKDIRSAERAFKGRYKHFTADFDSLTNFVLNEKLELERKIVDDDDSVALAALKQTGRRNIETFTIAVIDTIFAPRVLTPDQVRNLRFVPGTNKQTEFTLHAGTLVTESKVVIPVVECCVPYTKFLDTVKYRQEIINLIDDQVNNFNRYPGVKFGSMETGNNESGNWE
ncbi:MAG: hypothetical protein RR330_06500 [Alistipes sp.]